MVYSNAKQLSMSLRTMVSMERNHVKEGNKMYDSIGFHILKLYTEISGCFV
ncbi:hypothetical protein RchiOBHm_Chr6g0268971 [Rosa chinensis]|uniref:Uncharacterized protein n=1 Tax=Rosa chinensis TaxID=74649 RepID=A0A2P6PQE1_ROSCH|nr:hypothetical protein RchiOBHm_Chr6g0268971 [Rosa chinensis]